MCYCLIISFIMLKNSETYPKNLAVFTPQDFESMFGHFFSIMQERIIVCPRYPETLTTMHIKYLKCATDLSWPNKNTRRCSAFRHATFHSEKFSMEPK